MASITKWHSRYLQFSEYQIQLLAVPLAGPEVVHSPDISPLRSPTEDQTGQRHSSCWRAVIPARAVVTRPKIYSNNPQPTPGAAKGRRDRRMRYEMVESWLPKYLTEHSNDEGKNTRHCQGDYWGGFYKFYQSKRGCRGLLYQWQWREPNRMVVMTRETRCRVSTWPGILGHQHRSSKISPWTRLDCAIN